jgi:hypothetical protein
MGFTSLFIDTLFEFILRLPRHKISIFILLFALNWLIFSLLLWGYFHLSTGPGPYSLFSVLFRLGPMMLIGLLIIWPRMYFELKVLFGFLPADKIFEPVEAFIFPNYPVVLVLVLLSMLLIKWFKKVDSLKGFLLSELSLFLLTSAMFISLIGLD